MSHEINSMAYTGAKPWHGLGFQLPANASVDVWVHSAGMQWKICEAPLEFLADTGPSAPYVTYEGTKVLYRSDTLAPLSVVSSGYHLVQPSQVLEFFRDLVQTQGYELETAGCLKGGRRFWALARMQEVIELPGRDSVEGYLLLATSCDGTLATSVIPTSIRVVCANTLHATLHGAEGGVRIAHSRVFDADQVKARLNVARGQWRDYVQLMELMARKKVTATEAVRFFELALGGVEANQGEPVMFKRKRALAAVQKLYAGAGKGAQLEAANGTAWGLVNAVTEFVDYGRKTRSEDGRLSSAWFGAGARIKQQALEQCIFML
ncbi:MAG: DUF932 domain-containing protein [Gammaproteobacteria bacterium]